MAGIAMLVDPIAVDQTVVVRKAVAGSWYTLFITCYLFFPNDTTGMDESGNMAITFASEQSVFESHR